MLLPRSCSSVRCALVVGRRAGRPRRCGRCGARSRHHRRETRPAAALERLRHRGHAPVHRDRDVRARRVLPGQPPLDPGREQVGVGVDHVQELLPLELHALRSRSAGPGAPRAAVRRGRGPARSGRRDERPRAERLELLRERLARAERAARDSESGLTAGFAARARSATVPFDGTCRPISVLPSTCHGIFDAEHAAAIVGTMSIVRANAVVDPPALLVRELHEQRHERDVLRGSRVSDVAARLAGPVADAVVGGDDRRARGRRSPSPAGGCEDQPESAVGVPDLEQVALLGLHREPGVLPHGRADLRAATRASHAVPLARREVEPRHVGQQRVQQ